MMRRPDEGSRGEVPRRWVARGFALGAAMTALLALGRESKAEDKQSAAALFAEAGKLVEQNQPMSACPKYEASLRLHESVNTRYFLGDCYERIGKMASAWALFLEVAAQVHAAGDAAKEAKARERAAAVQPKVSHLTVVLEDKTTPAIQVKRDGAPVDPGQWGVPVPVDPGDHLVEASAPGKQPWTTRIQVEPNGAFTTVVVRALEDVPDADSAGGGLSRRTLALMVGGAGLVTGGVATALAVAAKSKFDESSDFCNGDRCDQHGIDIRASAVDRANVATVVFGVGLAAVVGGGVLWFTAPSSTKGASIGLTPTVGGVLVKGRF